jgi:hypothetical protein
MASKQPYPIRLQRVLKLFYQKLYEGKGLSKIILDDLMPDPNEVHNYITIDDRVPQGYWERHGTSSSGNGDGGYFNKTQYRSVMSLSGPCIISAKVEFVPAQSSV